MRVQANRLRHLLDEYYLGPGSQDPVRIVLPLGSYHPLFERCSASAAERGLRPSVLWSGLQWARSWRTWAILIVIFLAIVGAAHVFRSYLPANSTAVGWSYPEAPVVVVESANEIAATNDAKDAAKRVVIALESRLSVFDHFVVERRADPAGRDRPDYVLSVSVGPSSGIVNAFTFQLVSPPTNEIIWSRTFPGINLGAEASIDAMTQAVVSAVGELHMGAIMADQRRRAAMSKAPLQGYACLLAAYDYVLSRSLAKRGPARECLEREVSRNAQDPHALMLLSALLLFDYIDLLPGNQGLADLDRAATLAQLAFEILPFRSETSTTLFRSRFYAGRFDEAFGITRQLLNALPNSRLLAANVGEAYIARGRYDEGVAILSRFEMADLGAPPISAPMLALAAYMRGDEESAERFANRAEAGQPTMGLVMRIVVCEAEKNQACVFETSQQLRQDYPGFAADVPTALFRHALADNIRARLLVDLRAAGLFGEKSK